MGLASYMTVLGVIAFILWLVVDWRTPLSRPKSWSCSLATLALVPFGLWATYLYGAERMKIDMEQIEQARADYYKKADEIIKVNDAARKKTTHEEDLANAQAQATVSVVR